MGLCSGGGNCDLLYKIPKEKVGKENELKGEENYNIYLLLLRFTCGFFTLLKKNRAVGVN